jgi:RimJ/RimL family protein N-acetyltransferase
VRRVVAETLEEHATSRRVMERAGMRYHHARVGEVDGRNAPLVVYEAVPNGPRHVQRR